MQTIATIDRGFYRILGIQLRKAREMKNMTQKEVAKKMGLAKSTYLNWEYGYTKIKPKYWDQLTKILDLKNPIEINVDILKRYE